jgi:hypothetical protein
LAAAACAVPTVGIVPTSPNGESERAYQEMLTKYTGRAEAYNQLETHLFAAATYQSLPFREARVRRQAEFQSVPGSLVESRLSEERARASQELELFFAAYVNDTHYDDFDRSNSIWRLALATEAGEVSPSSITRLGRATYNTRAYYPYAGDFWTTYRVRFPRALPSGAELITPSTSQVKLKIASTFGQVELSMQAQ